MSNKTVDFLNKNLHIQKAEIWGKKATILFRELRRPFYGQGGIFWDLKCVIPQLRLCVVCAPTNLTFYFKRRFMRLFSSCRIGFVRRGKTKKAEVRFIEPLTAHMGSIKRASAFSLFPVFEQLFHNCVHSCFHTLFQHLHHKRIHHSLLLFLALLFLFFSLAHFITFTTLLNVILGIITSGSAFASSLAW